MNVYKIKNELLMTINSTTDKLRKLIHTHRVFNESILNQKNVQSY